MKQLKATLGGEPWLIRWVSRLGKAKEWLVGYCDYKRGVVLIRRGLSERDELGALIHECTHASLPFLDEEFVERLDIELVAILYDKLGYRRVG